MNLPVSLERKECFFIIYWNITRQFLFILGVTNCMPYMEIASLLGGALSGFIFKMMAQKLADEQARFEMFIKTIQAKDASNDAAVKRVPNDKAGNWIRRLIVIAILFGVILAPFVLALMDKPLTVEIETPVKQHLFGLFSTGGKTLFYELHSYLLIPELRSALLAILGFYFGNASAKR